MCRARQGLLVQSAATLATVMPPYDRESCIKVKASYWHVTHEGHHALQLMPDADARDEEERQSCHCH